MDHAPEWRRPKFLRNASILHFLSQNYLPLCWERHVIYNFLSPYPTDAIHTGQDWPSSSRYLHTTDANPYIAIGHPSGSGDLKYVILLVMMENLKIWHFISVERLFDNPQGIFFIRITLSS